MKRDAMELHEDQLLAHSAFLRRLALSLVRDVHEAEDVVQDTYVAALRSPPSGSVPAWLRRVVRNVGLRRLRDRRRRKRRERHVASSEAHPSASELAGQLELQRLVVTAVSELDQPYRETVVLRFYYDRTPSQIAEQQRIPVETVKTRLKRGLKRLRARLDAAHDGDRRAWVAPLAAFALPDSDAAASASTVAWGEGRFLLAASVGLAILGLGLVWNANRGDKELVPRSGRSESTLAATPTESANDADRTRNVALPGDGRTEPSMAKALPAPATPRRTHFIETWIETGTKPVRIEATVDVEDNERWRLRVTAEPRGGSSRSLAVVSGHRSGKGSWTDPVWTAGEGARRVTYLTRVGWDAHERLIEFETHDERIKVSSEVLWRRGSPRTGLAARVAVHLRGIPGDVPLDEAFEEPILLTSGGVGGPSWPTRPADKRVRKAERADGTRDYTIEYEVALEPIEADRLYALFRARGRTADARIIDTAVVTTPLWLPKPEPLPKDEASESEGDPMKISTDITSLLDDGREAEHRRRSLAYSRGSLVSASESGAVLTAPSGSYFWLNDLAAHPERYPILPRKGTAGRSVGLVVDRVKSLLLHREVSEADKIRIAAAFLGAVSLYDVSGVVPLTDSASYYVRISALSDGLKEASILSAMIGPTFTEEQARDVARVLQGVHVGQNRIRRLFFLSLETDLTRVERDLVDREIDRFVARKRSKLDKILTAEQIQEIYEDRGYDSVAYWKRWLKVR